MGLTILSDFDRDDLEQMMDLEMKYTHNPTFFEDVSTYFPTYELAGYNPRSFCTEKMKEHSNPTSEVTSWATATIAAAEHVLRKANIEDNLSLDYILKCLPEYAELGASREVAPRDIIEFISMKGLMNEEDAEGHTEETLCTFNEGETVYRFTTGFPEAINQSGLKNLSCSGYPIVTLMALDLVRFRTVRNMTNEDVYRGAYNEPTVYGMLQGYTENTWSVDLYVVPCERVHLSLPLLDSKKNPYAGIAAYAFSIENVNTEIASNPSEEPTSDVPTTTLPTTAVPTTTLPTTVPPLDCVDTTCNCNDCNINNIPQDVTYLVIENIDLSNPDNQMDLSEFTDLVQVKVLGEYSGSDILLIMNNVILPTGVVLDLSQLIIHIVLN